MTIYQAQSIARPVAHSFHSMRAGRFVLRARVLAVFDRVCDIVTDQDEIIALVTPDIGNGPLNTVVDAPPGVWAGILPQQTVETNSNSIRIGPLVIDLSNAALWEPCPDWASLSNHRNKIFENIAYLKTWLGQKDSLHSSGLMALLDPQSLATNQSMTLNTARQAASDLMQAIASNDPLQAREAASRLVGLGAGLTPAGDDFLIGVLACLWLNLQSPISHTIARIASNKTTTLSLALLNAAARGEFGVAWHTFFDALKSNDTTMIEHAAQGLLEYGHTSGADMLTGFMMTAEAVAPVDKPTPAR